MKANIYIDGFNFYYGCIRKTPYHWLNIAKLCQLLLPRDEIATIKYFTALVTPRPNDPEKLIRQERYLRALKTIPNLEIIKGTFLSHTVTMRLAPPQTGFAKVIKTEEKGSDVNIATHLLIDGFMNKYELAVIVSNDSDLLEPIRFVKEGLNKPVGILNPQKNPSVALQPLAYFIKNIRKGALSKSLFPNTLSDEKGSFSKPSSW
ncbi:MAG: NYN domain-containing protein [Anaerolineales bacterium]|uniref:NYN domain-containing protein n=1 Tax=Candidatus Desulfolinea nitratireducens TaxID=2841698 RepID=A0A8J6NKQ5_9CHLR|nr:NYN domain-containing protein [Candidatus Desulfolinea nitratireducens]